MKPTYSELLQMSTAELADLVVAQGAQIDSLKAHNNELTKVLIDVECEATSGDFDFPEQLYAQVAKMVFN